MSNQNCGKHSRPAGPEIDGGFDLRRRLPWPYSKTRPMPISPPSSDLHSIELRCFARPTRWTIPTTLRSCPPGSYIWSED